MANANLPKQNSRDPLQEPLLATQDSPADTWIMIRIEQEEIMTPEKEGEDNLSDIRAADEFLADDDDESSAPDSPWYSNPLQVTAMVSNFSTSYNVVNISLVLPILEQLQTTTTTEDAAAVASSLLAGMIVGQVAGGALGDSWLGRLGALRLVMLLQVIASLGSSMCGDSNDVYEKLSLWRFVLGVGSGGVYPLAAVLSAEEGGKKDPSDSLHRVVLTFSTQGVGFLAAPALTVPLLYSVKNLRLVWRIILALGSLPGFLLMFLQWRTYKYNQSRREAVPLEDPEADVEETSQNQGEREEEVCSDGEDIGTVLDSQPETDDGLFRQPAEADEMSVRHGIWDAIRHEDNLAQKLLGTAFTWFLFDVLFYGNTLFEPIVIEAAFGARNHTNPVHLLQRIAVDSLILTSIALPGYIVAGFVMGKTTCGISQTPRFVMLQGFAFMFILYFAIGLNWKELRHYPIVLVVLYGLTFFSANYGPNTGTFVLPSLVYSPECRSTLNGLSAAAGKLGALTGATLFEPAADSFGEATVMLICSGIAVVAFIMTKLFVQIRQEHQDRHHIV